MTKSIVDGSQGLTILILAAVIFFVLSQVSVGQYIQWPFVIITTFIHEMGHGMGAMLTGGSLIKIEVFQNASGLATIQVTPGWQRAVVAASGLLAPSIVGAIFIITGKSQKASSIAFLVFSLFILSCCALWVRSVFGLLILLPAGLLFLLISVKGSAFVQHFIIQFIGVHMLVDTFTRTMRYLFTSRVYVAGQDRHSDTDVIAQHLVGGHLLWACIIAILAVSLFYFSLRHAYMK